MHTQIKKILILLAALASPSAGLAHGPGEDVRRLARKMPTAIQLTSTVKQIHDKPFYLHPDLLGVRTSPGGPLLDAQKTLHECMSYRVVEAGEAQRGASKKVSGKGKIKRSGKEAGGQAAFLSHVGRSTFARKLIFVFADEAQGSREIQGWVYIKGTGRNPKPKREGLEERSGKLPTGGAVKEGVYADALRAAGVKVLPILTMARRRLSKKERQRISPPDNTSMLRLVLDPFRYNDYIRARSGDTVETGVPGGGGTVKYPLREAAAALKEHHLHQEFKAKKKLSRQKFITMALEDMAANAGKMLAMGVTTSAKMKCDDLTGGQLADLGEVRMGYERGDTEHLQSIESLAGDLVQHKVGRGKNYNWGNVYHLVEAAKLVHPKLSEAKLKERFRKAFYRGYESARGKTLTFPTRALELVSAVDLKNLLRGYVRSGVLRRDTEYSQAELIDFMRQQGHIDDSQKSGFH